MFGDVLLKPGLISLMKGNWTPKPLAATLLAMQNDHGVTSFTIPLVGQFSRRELQRFLRMLSLGGEIKLGTLSLKRKREKSQFLLLLLTMCRFFIPVKQASRQWYFKFHQIIASYGFETNIVDDCVYHKFSGSKHIFLVLYVDDILLATNDIGMLHDTKRFLSKNFEMKDLGNASFVLGIEIHRDRSQGILGLSQRNYIEKVFNRFGM